MRIDRAWLKSNQGIGLILTLFFVGMLVYLELSDWAHVVLRDGFTLGFLPEVSTVLLIIFSVIMLFDGHRKAVLSKAKEIAFTSLAYTVTITAICYVYFYLMCIVGFLIVAPFFLTFSIHLLGIKSWKTSIISGLVISVAIYSVFRTLGITLPAGIVPIG